MGANTIRSSIAWFSLMREVGIHKCKTLNELCNTSIKLLEIDLTPCAHCMCGLCVCLLPASWCQFVTVNLLYSHDTEQLSLHLLVISHSTLPRAHSLHLKNLTDASTYTLFSCLILHTALVCWSPSCFF